MDKYKLNIVTDFEEWNDFVDRSPQGTLFSYSYYLNLATANWVAYWVKKGEQIKAGLILVLNKDGSAVISDDLVIHNGLMFEEHFEQNKAKARNIDFEITTFIAEWLDDNFNSIDLTLSPQFLDVRPFLWYNFHLPDCKKYHLDLRYTSYVDISSLSCVDDKDRSPLFNNFDTLRRRNIREARKDGSTYELTNNIDLFINYYRTLLDGQGNVQNSEKLARMKRLMNGLINDYNALMVTSLDPKGMPMYITLYGLDAKRAYYLFGAPNPASSNRYKGTISFFEGFSLLSDAGVLEVDLEGINSPNRGKFKLGFSGSISPYYRLYKE